MHVGELLVSLKEDLLQIRSPGIQGFARL